MSNQNTIPYLLLTLHRELGIPLWSLVHYVCNESVPAPDGVSKFLHEEDMTRLEEFAQSKPGVRCVMSQLIDFSGISPVPDTIPDSLRAPLTYATLKLTPIGFTHAFNNWVNYPAESLENEPVMEPVITYLSEPSTIEEKRTRQDEIFFYALYSIPRVTFSRPSVILSSHQGYLSFSSQGF